MQIGIRGLIADPQLPYFLEWKSDDSLRPAALPAEVSLARAADLGLGRAPVRVAGPAHRRRTRRHQARPGGPPRHPGHQQRDVRLPRQGHRHHLTCPAGSAEARLGLFVHFGLYSGAARHEWVSLQRLTDDEYRVYFDHFEPDRFDARSIARAARLAGAGYVVLTTKHHEGFALWDTALSDFSAPRACGRDLVREFVDAVRAEGLRVGLYHSLIDWHHPDFAVDWVHPRRDDEAAHALNQGRDMARYRSFLHGQVRELLTGYGRIDYLFFDYTYPEAKDGWAGKSADDWDSAGLLALCRELLSRACSSTTASASPATSSPRGDTSPPLP